MTEDPGMENSSLWAPWRINYIQDLDKPQGCFLCQYRDEPQNDEKNLVLWRSKNCFVVMNKYPYNNGHFLISPNRHIENFEQANNDELLEINQLIREIQKALKLAIKPNGFNTGINFGRCAGAGLPGHLHIHVVPRWSGDTNYMHVCGKTDVISQSLTELFGLLKQISEEHGLPVL